MNSFIEEFYYGNIDPQARSFEQNTLRIFWQILHRLESRQHFIMECMIVMVLLRSNMQSLVL